MLSATADSSYSPRLFRHAAHRAALVCVVMGSQWTFLFLAMLYVREGRLLDIVSPELFAGVIAIGLMILVARIVGTGRPARADKAMIWLFCFLAVASLGEVLRPDPRLANVSTFCALAAYYVMGLTIGRDVGREDASVPALTALLVVYSVWYLAMLVFLIRGDLGFYGVLPTSALARLQFREGFRATELPIYVGFQFPVLLYILFAVRSPFLRIWASALAVCAVLLVAGTLSSGAMGALGLVLLIFLLAKRGMSVVAIARAALVLGSVIAIVMMLSPGLVDSVREKLENMFMGEGVRAVIYGELILDMFEHPFGIGKGRFVETNNFSWLGEGVYPHNNMLGIGAELGLPALILFMAFAVTVTVRLGRCALGTKQPQRFHLRMLAATILAMFVYQQFRGLFQDTWVVRETYLWVGLGMGALSSMTDREQGAEQSA